MAIDIRDYTPADEAAWLSCWGQVAVTSHAWGNPPYTSKPRHGGPALSLLAVVEGVVVGFIDIEIETKAGEVGLLTDSPCGFVWDFGVLPGFRRRGFGRELLVVAANRLAAAGLHRMEFWSMDEDAQAFYRRSGMTEINRHWRFWAKLSGSPANALGLAGDAPGSLRIVFAHGTCSVEDWPTVTSSGLVMAEPPYEPHLCLGFDYRF